MSALSSVLITGTSRGLGLALSDELAHRGWNVIGLRRAPALPLKTRPAGRDEIHADLSDDCCEQVIGQWLASRDQPLDVLINNAGIPGTATQFTRINSKEVVDLINVHVLGALRATRAAMPYLLRARNPVVINLSSRLGSMERTAAGTYANVSVSYSYRIAKAAQNMLSLAMSQDPSMSRISVLSVHPGRIRTSSSSSDADLSPEEAAEQFADFLSRRHSFNSGSFLETTGERLPW